MLKSNIKADSTKREQKRKLLQKKLSKDSVTSTKFYDSSEEREASSNTSSNVSVKILDKLNNTRNLTANNIDSPIYNNKTPLNSDYKKVKSNSQNLNSANTLDKINNTSLYNINSGKAIYSDKHSNETHISNKIDSDKLEVVDNQENNISFQIHNINNDILNTEEKKTKNLSKLPNISSDQPKDSVHTITFKDNIIEDENNIYHNFNNNSYLYSGIKSNYYTQNSNSYTIDNLNFYPDNNFNSCIGTNLTPYTPNSLNPYISNRLNCYTDNNLNHYYNNNLNTSANKNTIINRNIENSLPYLNNSEYTSKGIGIFNTNLNENYNITNEMDFLNMYNSRTPMDSSNINANDTLQYTNENTHAHESNYISDTISNTANETVNYNMLDKTIYDDNVNSNTRFSNNGKSVNGTTVGAFNYSDNKYENLMKYTSENNMYESNIIRDNKTMKDNVSVTENVSSHTDYSRAKHSSHVIDKRIVHEGFDTIKIPKYREVEIVEKIVEVPVVHKVNKYVNKYEIKEVEKVVKKPIKKYIETKIEVPELHFQDKIVEVPEVQEVVKIVEKPEIKERIIYKNKVETKIIPKYIEVPVVKVVNKYEEYDDIEEVIKTVPVKKIVEVPNEVIKQVKVPMKKIIEKPNYIPIIKYRDVPIEKIRYVPKIQTVELLKTIPKVIDVPVPVKVPKIKIINKPYYINKYVDKPVVIPVSKRIKPVYKYEGKKIIEIPIHKPYIVTHDTVISKNVGNNMDTGRCSVYTKKLDLNSFSPMKRYELFNMVNRNNTNLQRSMSVDNIFSRKNFRNSDIFEDINPNGNKENDITLSNNFSQLNYNKGQSILNKNHLNDLKFSRSLNNNIKINNSNVNTPSNNFYLNNPKREIDTFYSNEIDDSNNFQESFYNNTGLPINSNSFNPLINNNMQPLDPFSTLTDTKYYVNPKKNRNGYDLPFTKSTQNNNVYVNDINNSNMPYYFSNKNNVSNVNKLPNQLNSSINKIEDDCLNRYKSNVFSNNSFNDYGSSNNLPSFHNVNNNNNNSFIRSRSASMCSADGISAYAVEYVGDQTNRFNDSTLSNILNNNITDDMGSNYSFSGTLMNTMRQ